MGHFKTMTQQKDNLLAKLKAYKSEQGLTDQSLADKIGVSRSQITNVLNGRFAGTQTLLLYLERLGIKFELVQIQ